MEPVVGEYEYGLLDEGNNKIDSDLCYRVEISMRELTTQFHMQNYVFC